MSNLFGTIWVLLFDLWEKFPVNSFCKKVKVTVKEKYEETEKTIPDLKNEFPRVIFEGLRQCTKTEVRFELKDNRKPVFKTKKNVLFTGLDSVNQNPERLAKMGVISKADYSN